MRHIVWLQLSQTFGLITLCMILMFLGACSTKTPGEFIPASQAAASASTEQAMVNGCLQWEKEKQQQELAQYDKITGSTDKAMALMHRETMDMIKGVWGKGSECKPGTNVWDAYKVYVQETEGTKRKISGDVKSVATVGVVTGGAVKLADSLMDAAGDRISTSGPNSGVTKTTETTSSVAVANDKSQANADMAGSAGKGGTAATSSVNPVHWNECVTTTGGARPSNDEINGCMIGYGYSTSVVGDQIYLDGKPYSGPGGA